MLQAISKPYINPRRNITHAEIEDLLQDVDESKVSTTGPNNQQVKPFDVR